MRTTWLLAWVAAAAVGCGSDHEPTVVTTTGTIESQNIVGGAWLIHAENGTLYNPRILPDAFEVEGARVRVSLVERRDLGSVGPGVVADIVDIEEASCAGVMCGVLEPPVTVQVTENVSSSAVADVMLTNLSVPTLPPGSGGLTFGCATGPAMTTCFVDAIAPGTYAFDVTAPGYQASHVTVEVPIHQHVPGVCCESLWDPQTVAVSLAPAR